MRIAVVPDEPERRQVLNLSEEQMNEIADAAVDRAFERIQLEIGKSVINKIYWLAGLVVVALFAWAAANHIEWK
ncbi:MAG TPA: hypothetical protein VN794_18730 [Methylomirabilota bacterium]|nr:hypothetical protein [Methylomirabilota bacterium]